MKMKFPQARNNDIVSQRLNKELMIYDLKIDKAFCLNETAALVYAACDGQTTFAELKNERRDLTDEAIFFALDLLRCENLLEGEYESIFKNVSRREAIKKTALASLIALPVISSLVAPQAIHAASGCVNKTGPQRTRNTFLGYRSIEFCANDAFTCCSNSTRYDTSNCIEINSVTHQIGCTCYCN